MKEIESLIAQWKKRQYDYEDLAERLKDHPFNNRKYVYKALATRDCWKELLALQERSYSEEEVIDLLLARDIELNSFGGIDKAKEWFEQLKKK